MRPRIPSRARRVALVDDDAATLAMLALALQKAGFRVTAFPDADSALRRIAPGRFGWLVTDGCMPVVDGFELAARAKALDPELRVVMVSAVCSAPELEGSAVERFFSKPLELEDLIGWLRLRPGV